jgi:hypothetical protein
MEDLDYLIEMDAEEADHQRKNKKEEVIENA